MQRYKFAHGHVIEVSSNTQHVAQRGADPNRRHPDGTVFDAMLEWLHFVREDYKEDSQMMYLFNIHDMLTKRGATPNL